MEFQFLMVRLKAVIGIFYVNFFDISIPYGAIKSYGGDSYK